VGNLAELPVIPADLAVTGHKVINNNQRKEKFMSVDKKTVDHVAAMLTDDPRIFAEAGLLSPNQTDRRATRHANAIAKTSPPPPPPPPNRQESSHIEHVAPFTRQLGMLLENYDTDEVDSDPAGQAAVANVPAGSTDIKQAAEEIGVDSDEAQEMQNKLEQEKEEKKQREELRKKQVDPLFQQADKGLLNLSANTATALAQQDDAMQALTGLDRQKDELETLLNKINSLL
jgi:hypothetical protein